MKNLVTIFIVLPMMLHASGQGSESAHHGGLSDLIYPAINFSLLIAMLIYLLKDKVRVYYRENAESIKSMFENAEKGHRQAQNRLEDFNLKIANLDQLLEKVEKETISDIVRYKNELKESIDDQMNRLKRDSVSKLENEKECGKKQIQEEVVSMLIQDIREKIQTDRSLRKQVDQKLMSNI